MPRQKEQAVYQELDVHREEAAYQELDGRLEKEATEGV